MLKYSRGFRRVRGLIWLVFAIFVLMGYSVQNTVGSVYYPLLLRPYATVTTPPVILQNGAVGTSTIYTNSTSAKVSVAAPVPVSTYYYPSGYSVLNGTHVSGTVPSSVQTVDSDYLVIRTPPTTYYPSDYTLGGSTTKISGGLSNLTANDGVYMTFRSYTYYDYDYHYGESDGVSGTTETTWQDKVTLTFTSIADAYLVMASAELRGSSGSYDMEAQLTIDGTAHARLDTRPDETATDLYSHHFATFKAINLTAASHTFKIQYRSSSGFGNCSIQHARIAVFRIFDYAYAESEGSQPVSGGYSDKVTKTFNVEETGEYLVIASAELNPASTSNSILARMRIDSAYQDEVSLEAEQVTSSWESYFTHDIKSFDVGSHTVSVQARSEFGTHNIRRARVIAVRLTDYFLGWESGKSDSYTTNGATSWADKLVVTFTPSTQCEYLMLATARVGGDASNGENYHSSFDFTLDGTEEGWWHGGISDDNDRITYVTLKNSTLSEVSHSLKLRYHSESWTSPDAGMGSARIVAIPMCGLEAVEVEFIGSSNTYAWTQLEWTVDSAWTTGSVSVTLQLYNYSLGDYPTSGKGYVNYTSSATADTDETKSQTITANPTQFRNATGYWKMKVKGVKAVETQFNFKADWIEFKLYYSEYIVSTEFLFSDMTTTTPKQLNFTVVSEYNITSVDVTIQVWNYSSSAYVTSGEGYSTYTSTGTNVTKILSINTDPQFYTSSGNAKIKVTGVNSTIKQFQQKINQIKLDYKYVPEENIEDFVDNNTSNVGSPTDKGTHSNFTAQQYGPDSIYDTLTEENTGGEGGTIEDFVDNNTSDVDNSTDLGTHGNFENQKAKDSSYDTLTEDGGIKNWGITSSDFSSASTHATYRYMGGTSPNTQAMTVTRLWIRCGTSGTVAVALYTGGSLTDPTGATKRTEAYNVAVSAGWNEIDVADYSWSANTVTWIGWCHNASVYYSSSSSNCGDFQSERGRWNQDSPTDADETQPMPSSPGSGSFTDYWYAVYVEYDVPYQLDLEVQFTSVIDFLPTEKLCIYAGTLGAEDLNLDFWNGTGWENLATDLTTNSWNNYTVSLTSTTFTIRFKDGTIVGDTATQDQWQIDATLLRVEGAGGKEDAVDNDTSNIDGSDDVGTLSDFDSMKTKDGMANLTEGEVGGGTVWLWQEDTSGYSSFGSYETVQFWNSWTTNSTTSGTVTKIGIYVFADPGNSPQVKLGIYDDSGGSPNNLLGETNAATITGAGWLDLNIVGSGVNISASTTYHVAHITDIAPTTQWRYRKSATPVSDYRDGRVWPNLFDPAGATSKSSGYRYGPYRVGYNASADYRLDQEVQWTSIPYLLPNETLCIYGGTMGGEDIKVDAWNGTGWETVFNDLSSGWNNETITDWLATSNFTIRFKGGTETGDPSQDTWLIDIALIHIWNEAEENYVLDLEVQWTNANYMQRNEELCIKTGTTGAEDIEVDVWNGSEWINVITDLTSNSWNNVSVYSYLTSSSFTIRFKGGNETSDTFQDNWNIDATLLHVWTTETYDYILRVNNTVTDSWQIRLKKYSDYNITRLQNCTIYFHNSTDGTSGQIYIENGDYKQDGDVGTWYDLGDSETIYIAMTVEANSAGTSYIYVYLEILIPGMSTYSRYIIAFQIT